jgi:hypothetical protein
VYTVQPNTLCEGLVIRTASVQCTAKYLVWRPWIGLPVYSVQPNTLCGGLVIRTASVEPNTLCGGLMIGLPVYSQTPCVEAL